MAGITINLLLLMIITIIIPSHQLSSRKDPMNTATPKTTSLQFYFYDKVSNPNATAVPIVAGPTTTTSPLSFGRLTMIDDALLASPQLTNPEIIGRAQGMYGGADTRTPALLMVVNYVFTSGDHNGSSLSILGRNEVLQNPREMPIIGGTGLFRLARGFALARTVWFDLKTFDAMVHYNVTVYHYPNLN